MVPPAVISVDPAPGFMALRNDETLKSLRLSLEIGRVKNSNKNPVVEKAILEPEEELLKQEPKGGPVSQLGLVIAVARLTVNNFASLFNCTPVGRASDSMMTPT